MVRSVPLESLQSFIVIGATLCFGCAPSLPPCVTTAACGKGKLCVAGSCRNAKQAPAPKSAQRVMLEPVSIAVVSSTLDAHNRADIPFGKNALGSLVLLLRFPAPFSPTTQILSAFVVMDPATGAIAGPSPVELRIARIIEPWNAEEANWHTLPKISGIELPFLASTWARRTLRVDVTHIVKRWRNHRDDDQGLAIMASPQNDVGASYSLGLAGGRGPRLDVYLR